MLAFFCRKVQTELIRKLIPKLWKNVKHNLKLDFHSFFPWNTYFKRDILKLHTISFRNLPGELKYVYSFIQKHQMSYLFRILFSKKQNKTIKKDHLLPKNASNAFPIQLIAISEIWTSTHYRLKSDIVSIDICTNLCSWEMEVLVKFVQTKPRKNISWWYL